MGSLEVSKTEPSTLKALQDIRNKLAPIRRTGWQGKGLINVGYETDEQYLQSVIRQVVVGSTEGIKVSSSIMIYGPPGCGKSQFVDKAVKLLENEVKDKSPFDVVRLDGVYCFSLQDSVREMCNQIIDDPEMLEELGYSDKMAFDDKLESILFYLRNKLMERNRSLVVIIDGMEKFTDDSSQRLLYNLFDISANAAFSVPICIIGITPCVDILDSFEKRVRSRFSHRQINLIPKAEFPQYQDWAKDLLSHSKCIEWTDHTQKVLADKEVIKTLRSIYEADKSIGQLKRFLYFALILCEEKLTPANFKEAYASMFGCQNHVQMALDLPLSELVVLLGVYKKIQRSQQAWQPAEVFEIIKKPYGLYQLRKDDFIKTILKLQDLELVVPVGGNKNRHVGNLNESYFKCEISYLEFQDIWKRYPNLPSFFNEFL